MSLNHELSAVADFIAKLPANSAFAEARQIGEVFLQVLAEATIRTGRKDWQPYTDATAIQPDDQKYADNWQRLGTVTRRVLAGLKRSGAGT
jgi:hypothetical protein